MGSGARLTVLGSLNMDISVAVPKLPEPGATVLGGGAAYAPGGKGANQAVAAARLGAVVRMVGCVGDDDFGGRLRAALKAEGVSDEGVRVVPGTPTGLAMITVDGAGENMITVAPGANHEVGPPELAAATAAPADVLVISAEIPVAVIEAALAAAGPGPRVLNLAPAPPEAAALIAAADWLVVNESEAASLLGREISGLDGAAAAAAELAAIGARNVVVTAGGAGAVCHANSGPTNPGPTDPRHADSPHLRSSQVDSDRADSDRADSDRADSDRADSGRADSSRADPRRADAGHLRASPMGSGHGDSGHGDSGHGDSGHGDSGHGDPDDDDRSHRDRSRGDAGRAGASHTGPEVFVVPGFKVRAVDSVGAGDTFVAALAVALAVGIPARQAVRAAAAAGATAATRPGTQSGMPRPADILAATGFTWPIP